MRRKGEDVVAYSTLNKKVRQKPIITFDERGIFAFIN